MMNIPDSNYLNTDALAKSFSSTTNSYKYLFFLSILSILAEDTKKDEISASSLLLKMIRISWVPSQRFLLSLGSQDKMSSLTSNIKYESDFKSLSLENLPQHAFELLRYVPYRFLRPFFSEKLKGVKDGYINARILELSSNARVGLIPYKIELKEDSFAIKIDPLWKQYLIKNLPIVNGWAKLHWIKYLQSRNPNAPAIPLKIETKFTRTSLAKQRRLWSIYLSKHDTKCIYTGEAIHPVNFELDHYIPWSYVAHDQLWNLIPISKTVNIQKSNNVPSLEYLGKATEIQLDAVTYWVNEINTREILSDYLDGLGIDLNVLSIENFSSVYYANLETLSKAAALQGFNSNWKPYYV